MTTTSPLPTIIWQPDKYLQSGDRIWILTEVESFPSYYYEYSEPQTLFKVGVYDLISEKVGFAIFGKDIAYAILKSGVLPPPWHSPASTGIELHRVAHDREEKGRYSVKVDQLPIDPELMAIVPPAQKRFRVAGHHPNSSPGMWGKLEERAARENAIEAAVESMPDSFAAGDIKKIVGVNVTPTLKRLVRERKLVATGRKRGTRYSRASP